MQELLGKVAGKEKKKEEKGESEEKDNWKYIAKLYSGMKPDKVAAIFKDMDGVTVANILMRMGNRQAAKVMGALPPDKAIEITRILKEEKGK